MGSPRFDMYAYHYWHEEWYQATTAQFVADIDGDGKPEILLGGVTIVRDDDGEAEWAGELRIVDFKPSDQIVLRHQEVWTGIGSARVYAVFAADVDGDGKVEIITGGYTSLKGITRAHLRLFNWDEKSLKLKQELVWTPRPYPNAEINSLWAADIDGDGKTEIICGGLASDGESREQAWFDVFALNGLTWTRKGRMLWPVVKGQFSNIDKIAVADVDGDGKLELVTLGHQRNSFSLQIPDERLWGNLKYPSIVKAKAQLIVWEPLPGDNELVFQKKAETIWKKPEQNMMIPTSMWIGDIFNEKSSLDIVTTCAAISGSLENFDFCGTDLRIWRLSGNSLNLTNLGSWQFIFRDTYYTTNLPTSIQGADINGDNKKELVLMADIATKETHKHGLILAINPAYDLMDSSREDEIFIRHLTFATETDDGLDDTFTRNLNTLDIDTDGRIEVIISFNYHSRSGAGCGEIVSIGR